jgi:hypothetical protein
MVTGGGGVAPDVAAWPRASAEQASVPLQGFCRPLLKCRGVDLGLTTQRRTMVGMASPGELAEQRRGVIPKCARGVVWIHL